MRHRTCCAAGTGTSTARRPSSSCSSTWCSCSPSRSCPTRCSSISRSPASCETVLLLMAVWWVWIYTTWVTNWLDPDKTPVRLMLFALMLAGLVLSTSIPDAFGEQGAGVRRRLRLHAARPQPVHAVGAARAQPRQLPQLPAHQQLAGAVGACSGSPARLPRARRGSACGSRRWPSSTWRPRSASGRPGSAARPRRTGTWKAAIWPSAAGCSSSSRWASRCW